MKQLLLRKSGFTLVELLIVIALIGALAIGLFAAIDPIEQIRRAQDTSRRNLAREYHSAQQRFYTTRSAFNNLTAGGNATALNGHASLTDAGTNLMASGELKSNFVTQAGTTNLNNIFVSVPASGDTVIVCFLPTSRSMRGEAASSRTNSGGTQAGCPSSTATNCYQCFD